MAIAVASVSTGNFTTGSVTITKPSGLTVGDFMVLILGNRANASIPSTGFTTLLNGSSSMENSRFGIFYKVADSSDVAASNFTFNASGGSTPIGGVLYRITGSAGISFAEAEAGNITDNPATISITPQATESLIILVATGGDNDGSTGSFSAYTSTGSPTYTERYDQSITNIILAVADAPYAGLTEITSIGATYTGSTMDTVQMLALVLGARVDETGTTNLLVSDTLLYNPTGTSGTTGTNVLLEVNPIFPEVKSRVSDSGWVKQTKTDSTWTDQTK